MPQRGWHKPSAELLVLTWRNRRNEKKLIGSVFVLLLIIVPISFYVYTKNTLPDIPTLINNEDIDDITMTIYYLDPYSDWYQPVSDVEGLIDRCDDKIVIRGKELQEHVDLFKQMRPDVFMPVIRKSSDLNLQVYYVLESRTHGKIFDVAMWGGSILSCYVFK